MNDKKAKRPPPPPDADQLAEWLASTRREALVAWRTSYDTWTEFVNKFNAYRAGVYCVVNRRRARNACAKMTTGHLNDLTALRNELQAMVCNDVLIACRRVAREIAEERPDELALFVEGLDVGIAKVRAAAAPATTDNADIVDPVAQLLADDLTELADQMRAVKVGPPPRVVSQFFTKPQKEKIS